MTEYRFVCVDARGTWRGLTRRALSGEAEAKAFGQGLLRRFPAVIVYEGERRLAMLAQIA
jgi:hypothetical protein